MGLAFYFKRDTRKPQACQFPPASHVAAPHTASASAAHLRSAPSTLPTISPRSSSKSSIAPRSCAAVNGYGAPMQLAVTLPAHSRRTHFPETFAPKTSPASARPRGMGSGAQPGEQREVVAVARRRVAAAVVDAAPSLHPAQREGDQQVARREGRVRAAVVHQPLHALRLPTCLRRAQQSIQRTRRQNYIRVAQFHKTQGTTGGTRLGRQVGR